MIYVVSSTSLDGRTSLSTKNDKFDSFNRPRARSIAILSSLRSCNFPWMSFITPSQQKGPATSIEKTDFLKVTYGNIHKPEMIVFLCNAWDNWVAMGSSRDSNCFHPVWNDKGDESATKIPPLVPQNFLLSSEAKSFRQRPSKNVMGQIGYYCTDLCTPIISSLLDELISDANIVLTACSLLCDTNAAAYALTIHPGHHSSKSSFGGYCYLNNAALAAETLLHQTINSKVAILDIDFHCGNGTAEIFAERKDVFTISLHCDPNVEYPFHCGFKEDTRDTMAYVPLKPGITWEGGYQEALEEALKEVECFGSIDALVVSLGLDTFGADPIAMENTAFSLTEDDYILMGEVIGKFAKGGEKKNSVKTLFVQEGGYMIEKIGDLVSNVLKGFARGRDI